MNIFLGIIIGLFVLMALIVAHEFGHFIAARRNGVTVKEFGIGFPPRAIAWIKGDDGKWHRIPKSDWQKEQSSLVFSINWLPIGGFCSMDGESASDKRKGTFGASSFLTKTKILFAGVGMNWLVSFLLLTVLAWIGMPTFIENQFSIASDATVNASAGVTIVEVMADSPADKAGFQQGDKIISAQSGDSAPSSISYATHVSEFNQAHAGKEVTYVIARPSNCENNTNCEPQQLTLPVQLNSSDAEFLLGITMSTAQSFTRYTWSAPLIGIGTTIQFTGETFRSLGEMLWNLISGTARQISFNGDTREAGRQAIGTATDGVTGPVGILGSIFPAFAETGISNILFLAAIISISLACMNILPIPALDGGRWLLIAIYKIRKKKLSKAEEEKHISRSFVALFVLIIIVTLLDILRFFK